MHGSSLRKRGAWTRGVNLRALRGSPRGGIFVVDSFTDLAYGGGRWRRKEKERTRGEEEGSRGKGLRPFGEVSRRPGPGPYPSGPGPPPPRPTTPSTD